MPSIKELKQNIANFEKLIAEYEKQLVPDTENFAIKLTVDNLKSQISELRKELYKENLKREKEIIKIRFQGNKAKFGSLPLETLGNLASSISEAVFQTSKYMKYGKRSPRNANEIVKSEIDLRIADIEQGSTILYLTGDTSPDLFGNSIIQDSLENIFVLLNSENEEILTENITKVGSKGVRGFTKLFAHLNKETLDLNLKWRSPEQKTYNWDGDQQKILSLYNTFNQLNISEPEEIHFEGELITISLKRKFEISVKKRFTYSGEFPFDLMKVMKGLHIGSRVRGVIVKTTYYNPLTDKEKHEYMLKKISAY